MKKLFYSTILLFLISCSSSQKVEVSDNPLDAYLLAKSQPNNDSQYSLEYLRAKAAQYLLSQGKTELKAGNSGQAVKYLSQAREYNPWNDEIKDLYLLSIKFLIKSTQSLQNESCEIINDRLSLIYLVANDQINQFQIFSKKCKFEIKNNTAVSFNNLPLKPSSVENEKKIFASLEDQAISIIQRNQNPPIRELLYLAMDFISALKIETGKPKISALTEDRDNIKILLPISVILKQPRHSEDYCLKTKDLLSRKEFQDEVFSPNYMKGALGVLKCRYYTYETKYLEFATNPSWHEKIHFYPIPKNTTYLIKFHYKNGTEQSFKNIINTSLDPDNIELMYGFNFDFIEGDLPLKLKPKSFIQQEENYLEITTNLNNIKGLEAISIELDLDATFKNSLKENSENNSDTEI